MDHGYIICSGGSAGYVQAARLMNDHDRCKIAAKRVCNGPFFNALHQHGADRRATIRPHTDATRDQTKLAADMIWGQTRTRHST